MLTNGAGAQALALDGDRVRPAREILMETPPRTSWLIGTVASLVLLGAVVAAGTEQQIGTVKTVDPAARRLWLITGTGHSLRVLSFHASVDCRIEVSGTSARLADIERGHVVVIRYRTEEPYEAISIVAKSR